MAKVSIPAGLQKYFKNETELKSDAPTVRELLAQLEKKYPESREKILASSDVLCRYIRIFVDNEDIGELEKLETPLNAKTRVKILMALAGG